jgi:hypothetical protein
VRPFHAILLPLGHEDWSVLKIKPDLEMVADHSAKPYLTFSWLAGLN